MWYFFLSFVAGGAVTVEILQKEQEVFKITETYLEHLKNEGVHFPYFSVWNKLRNLYDIPRKRVRHVVTLLKENVFVLKNQLIENDYDFTKSP